MKSRILLTLAGLLALAACQAENPGLTTRPKVEKEIYRPVVTQKGEMLVAEYDSRVDILFVIDNSKSMENHQQNLARQMPEFVKEFAKIKTIDFHIGITTVWDSSRYGKIVPATCPDGSVNWEPAGTLVPLIGASDKLPTDGRRFLTRDDADFVSILSDSLNPRTNPRLFKDFVNPDANHPELCPSGPEKEEVFTPMLAALENDSLAGNAGFRRPGAFLVVILVSDAKSEDVLAAKGKRVMTPETVRDELAELTGQAKSGKKKFRVFSVAYKSGTVISNSCLPDPAFDAEGTERADGTISTVRRMGAKIQPGENPLETLALLTADEGAEAVDQVHSICDHDYGRSLGKYSALIKEDALSDLVLKIDGFPPQIFKDPQDERRLRVFLGDKVELVEGEQWRYEGDDKNRVIVYGNKVDWDAAPGEKVRLQYVPADPSAKTTKVYDGE